MRKIEVDTQGSIPILHGSADDARRSVSASYSARPEFYSDVVAMELVEYVDDRSGSSLGFDVLLYVRPDNILEKHVDACEFASMFK